MWDWHPEDDPRKMIDLQVHTKADRYLFEAKWWNDERGSVAVLASDAEKLRSLPGEGRRYLLAFWWNEDAQWTSDEACVEDAVTTLNASGGYLTKFPVRTAKANTYFGFAAFELRWPAPRL